MVYNLSGMTGHPPLLVFTFCLAACGCTMIVLAYVIGEQEVPNPDVKMDWNKLFQRLSDLHLCPLGNTTAENPFGKPESAEILGKFSANASVAHVVDESRSMSAVLSNVVDSPTEDPFKSTAFEKLSVRVQFRVRQGKVPAFPFTGSVRGKQLGFTGKYAQLLFNLSLGFVPVQNDSCTKEESCHALYNVCMSMKIPAEILPKTKTPELCKNSKFSTRKYQPTVFSELDVLDEISSESRCLALIYTPDITLTEMLSAHDRSVVNLHLMHTSYLMFVMAITLVLYSVLRNRFPLYSYQPLHKNTLSA